ncbi:hypothetical protein IQE94_13195 [Synechocystis sp. PCC 7339]|uniref:hypothetical protein n=1 Tax=Synechocystis sp. PCC 7339 TaxID=2782213 RepID=UPI001CC00A04|nr:hypothetical protein [Synechocystis sp. PCC 7339]UAJ72052.1 hypothetical protein IQE94_13195 [Synechocystis sp. PCC 7339]
MKIIINEFSTGIKVIGSAHKWHSQGFTENYLNKTVDKVPPVIELAIANKLLSVAEGGALEKPSLIAREIQDDQGEWSVVAVVTRALDEGNRPLPTYRYFFSSGLGKISFILRWWSQLRPIFNPYDVKYPGDEIECEVENIEIPTTNFEDLLNNNNYPIIFHSNKKVSELIINAVAERIAKKNDQLVAWAYNVTALETINSFQVIFPSSEKSEEVLQKFLSRRSSINNVVQDESAIKKAISLLSQNKIKPEHLKTIENALGNPAIDDKYCRSMFDSQGASEAIKQGNYGHSMIRLLTLQAMMLPETLLSFLNWLAKRGKQKEQYDISNDFQAKVLGHGLKLYPKIEDKIYRGTQIIILTVKDNDELIETAARLLTFNHGVWCHVYRSNFQDEFESVIKGKLRWDHQWTRIASDIRGKPGIDKDYLRIAKLFVEIKDPVPAALFYYLGCGLIPRWLFNDLAHFRTNQHYIKIYGFSIQREISSLEYVWLSLIKLGKTIMPVYLFTPLLIIAILGSAFITYFGASRWFKPKPYVSSLEIITWEIMKQEPIKKSEKIKQIKGEQEKLKAVNKALALVLASGFEYDSESKKLDQLSCKVAEQINPNEDCVDIGNNSAISETKNLPPITPQDINLNNQKSFNTIVQEIKNRLKVDSQNGGENTIKNQILEIFKQYDNTIPAFDYLSTINPGEDVIKKYQISKGLGRDGKIDQDGQTFNALKCDVAKKLTEYLTSPISGCSN